LAVKRVGESGIRVGRGFKVGLRDGVGVEVGNSSI